MSISLENNHSLIVEDYTKPPQWKHNKLTEIKQNQLLIQVEASTINPSDVLSINGKYRSADGLPLTGGKQGVGRVIQTGDKAKQFQGKRVCFCNLKGGAWSHYTIAISNYCFIIDEDVEVSSAASGIVNPLTVIGFIHEVKRRKQKSIAHTAAASALGRMLNKICQSEGITLLNVVRRQQHYDILKSQGAQNIIITTGDWETEYKQKIKELDSKILFDALGGGDVQTKLIQNHPQDGAVLVYGLLEGQKPGNLTTISFSSLIGGLEVTGFILNKWLQTITQQEYDKIRAKYSAYLKNQLSSTFSKEFKFQQINQALQYYKNNATNGKILLRP